ncbi:DNA-3-methyladenine glycosylase [Streptosporangium fragile]|uniref:DNA-3-methyladenine glycosylase n=1 Tax=Streptosporangium fragile TaxID=46186 RepID=UPI0031F08025
MRAPEPGGRGDREPVSGEGGGDREPMSTEGGDGHPLASSAPLPRDFFDRPSHEVAPDLLGRVLVHGPVAVRLTEVEAYGRPGEDPASHTYRGQTRRNTVMFGPPGHLYVYFTYGMHFCANLTCLPERIGSGVLLRAGEVITGVEVALARRAAGAARTVPERDLARGPARLAVALGFTREHNGLDACVPGPLSVLEGEPAKPSSVLSGPRTGVSSAQETPWRFWIDGDPTVSPHRRHVPRRR